MSDQTVRLIQAAMVGMVIAIIVRLLFPNSGQGAMLIPLYTVLYQAYVIYKEE